MTEDELEAEMEALCPRLGLVYHHCRHSRRCRGAPGFPDLTIAGPRGVMFRELKSENGETSPGQDLWGWLLQDRQGVFGLPAGQVPRWRVWRPGDLESGEIRAELEQLR